MKNRTHFASWFLCVIAGVILTTSADLVWGQVDATSAVQPDVVDNSRPPTEKQSSVDDGCGAEDCLRLNFRGASLDTVLDYLSKAAGFVVVRDTEVTGRVDVWSHQPLTKDEAVNLLNTVLNEKGFAAIRNGRTLMIVDRDSARTRDLPVRTGSDPEAIEKTDEMVTHIIPVQYADVGQLIEDLEPLLPSYAIVTANENSNAIVLTDTQANIRRMVEIIRALDTSFFSISALKVFRLNYSKAAETATMINELFAAQDTGGAGAGFPPTGQFASQFRGGIAGSLGGPPGGAPSQASADTDSSAVREAASLVLAVADERTNAVAVRAPDELMPVIDELIEQIDTAIVLLTEVRVFPLEHADADEMADMITDIFEDDDDSSQTQAVSRFLGGGPGPSFGPPAPPQQGITQSETGETSVMVAADTRTNSVVVRAVSETMDQIEQLIKELDRNPAKDQKVFIYSLKHADVEGVAEILHDIFDKETTWSGSSSGSASSQTQQSTYTGGTLGLPR